MHSSKFVVPAFVGSALSTYSSSKCLSPNNHCYFRHASHFNPRSTTKQKVHSSRAKLYMNSIPPSNSNNNINNNNSNNNDNTNNTNDNKEDQQQQHDDTSSSNNTEFQFNQDVLRDRIANLDSDSLRSQSQTTSSSKTFSIYSDSTSTQYIQEEAQRHDNDQADDDNDEQVEIEIEDEMIDDNQLMEHIQSFNKIGKAWVILFTNIKDGSEGIYSLTLNDKNIVLAFEEKYEAQRYSISLEAQKFPKPQIVEMDVEKLKSFCSETDLKLGFVPAGKIILPPEQSVIDDIDTWRGKPTNNYSGMSQDDIDVMRKRLDSLFGQ